MATEHIVIDSQRNIFVPESVKKIGVQYDHNVNTITFDCPRYWDEHDMSAMDIYITYKFADTDVYYCKATNITIDEVDPMMMHFDWPISSSVTMVAGPLDFMVCIKKNNDIGELIHWNSTVNSDLYVAPGLDCGEGNGVLVLDLAHLTFDNSVVSSIISGLSSTTNGLSVRFHPDTRSNYDANTSEGAFDNLIATVPNWKIIC